MMTLGICCADMSWEWRNEETHFEEEGCINFPLEIHMMKKKPAHWPNLDEDEKLHFQVVTGTEQLFIGCEQY